MFFGPAKCDIDRGYFTSYTKILLSDRGSKVVFSCIFVDIIVSRNSLAGVLA